MPLLQRIGGAALAAVVFVGVVGVLVWLLRPRFDAEEVRRTVVTTIQQEAPASFYVTGTLEVTVTEEVAHTRQLFPTLFALLREAQPSWPSANLATSQATVRVPGRISYGFDVTALDSEDIDVEENGVVHVRLPALSVFATEPYLEHLEVKTETTGWMRLFGDREEEAEREALAGLREALRRQGEVRLEEATQPRVNTARALEALLRPALVAAGVPNPRFRFAIDDELVLQPRGDSLR